jgi:hypothetical protein
MFDLRVSLDILIVQPTMPTSNFRQGIIRVPIYIVIAYGIILAAILVPYIQTL